MINIKELLLRFGNMNQSNPVRCQNKYCHWNYFQTWLDLHRKKHQLKIYVAGFRLIDFLLNGLPPWAAVLALPFSTLINIMPNIMKQISKAFILIYTCELNDYREISHSNLYEFYEQETKFKILKLSINRFDTFCVIMDCLFVYWQN